MKLDDDEDEDDLVEIKQLINQASKQANNQYIVNS